MKNLQRVRTRRQLLRVTAVGAATIPLLALAKQSALAQNQGGNNQGGNNQGGNNQGNNHSCFLKGTKSVSPVSRIICSPWRPTLPRAGAGPDAQISLRRGKHIIEDNALPGTFPASCVGKASRRRHYLIAHSPACRRDGCLGRKKAASGARPEPCCAPITREPTHSPVRTSAEGALVSLFSISRAVL
jgi:hypothetical protein